jgi:phage FluMu protein Com
MSIEEHTMAELDMDDPVAEQVLDGNALAGTLEGLFGGDMTAVPGRCAHCGTVSAVGAMRAYTRAPGAVLRCPACKEVVLRVVETVDATYVDARGAAYLRFERR